jgi:hypothetical protein
MAIIQSGEVQINGSLFAANLPRPQSFVLSIKAHIAYTEKTLYELTALDEPDDYGD